MPLSGAHIVAGYPGSSQPDKSQPILGKIAWSESPASGVATTNSAPAVGDALGQPIFRLRSSVDAFFAIGKTPNPSASPRIFVPANTDYDIFTDTGDKAAWVVA